MKAYLLCGFVDWEADYPLGIYSTATKCVVALSDFQQTEEGKRHYNSYGYNCYEIEIDEPAKDNPKRFVRFEDTRDE